MFFRVRSNYEIRAGLSNLTRVFSALPGDRQLKTVARASTRAIISRCLDESRCVCVFFVGCVGRLFRGGGICASARGKIALLLLRCVSVFTRVSTRVYARSLFCNEREERVFTWSSVCRFDEEKHCVVCFLRIRVKR